MFDFDLDLDLGSRRQPRQWAVAVHDMDMPQKTPKRRTQRERKQNKRERKAAAATAAGAQPAGVQLTPAQAKYRKEFRDPNVVCLSTEIENGNVEYKYNLTGCITNPNRRHQLTTQMKFRLSEGGSECFYYIGVEDDGYPRGLESREMAASIGILQHMAVSLSATARLVEYVPGGFGATAALLHVKANAEEDMRATDLRVAVAGSMDSGKSTLVAVLTHGNDGRPLLDNCRGSARMAVFRHKHEIETGRTSSISQQVLGYDEEGRVLNYVGVAVPTPADITAAAVQLVQFLDMGGHEKYLKTTLYGMTCMLPDYVLLCVDAVCGVSRITREHLAVAVALEIPTALIITKTDAVSEKQLLVVLRQLQEILEPVLAITSSTRSSNQPSASLQRLEKAAEDLSPNRAAVDESTPVDESTAADDLGVPVVNSEAQAAHLAAVLSDLHSCTAAGTAASFQQVTYPVFMISCVTGSGLSLLHCFLSKLQPISTFRMDALGKPGHISLSGSNKGEAVPQQTSRAAGGDTSEVHWSQQQWQQLPKDPRSCQLWLPGVHVDSCSASNSGSCEMRPLTAGMSAVPSSAGMVDSKLAVTHAGMSCYPAGHFQVVHTYDVQGVGWVVSGIAVAGIIEVGQSLLWGPTADGGFSPVSVSCIQRSHVPVRQVQPGQTATLALQPVGVDGLPLGSSKEALLSAAAAAQAAAEEQAAREAAAACATAPDIAPGKPHVAAVASGSNAAQPQGGMALHAVDSTASSSSCASYCCVVADESGGASSADGIGVSRLDMLVDDLADGLALSDDEVEGSTAPDYQSDADSLNGFFDHKAAGEVHSSSYRGASRHQQMNVQDHRGAESRPGSTSHAVAGASAGLCSGNLPISGISESLHARPFGCNSIGTAVLVSEVACENTEGPPVGSSSHMPRLVEGTLSASSSVTTSTASLDSLGLPSPLQRAVSGAQAACSSNRFMPAAEAATPAAGVLALGSSPPASRSKGTVLLDSSAAPCTYWEFEALLVLLGGHWPARGLLSGCWPPEQPSGTTAVPGRYDTALEDTHVTAAGQQGHEATQAVECRQRKKCKLKRHDYAYVIHCNSIRQVARIVHMQEVREPEMCQQQNWRNSEQGTTNSHHGAGESSTSDHQVRRCTNIAAGGLSVSIKAAAALLQCDSHSCSADGSSSGGGRASSSSTREKQALNMGSVVLVKYKFCHRAEWMQMGAKLIVRDRSDGHVAAAGFVTQLLKPHMQR